MGGLGEMFTIPMLSTTIRTDHIHRAQITHRQFRSERPVSNRKKHRKRWCRKRFFNRLRKRRRIL